jgi:Ras-related protein Rab-18
MNSLFIETSAKTAVGVSEAFKEVAEKILDTPELWAPVTPGQNAGGSTVGNRTRVNDNSMPGNINLDSNEPQSQEGCAC